MPTLRIVEGSAQWGDMFLLGGAVFSVDADGYLVLSYGKPVRVNTNVPPNLNDDGSSSNCVQIAFAHLGLPVPTDRVSHEELAELLKGFEVIEYDSTVGDFINTHRSGNYFVVAYDGHGTHAFALADGRAFNIKPQLLGRHIRCAWRMQKE